MATVAGIKLGDGVRERLKVLGEIRMRSPHWLMRAAIEDYLEREEAFEREKREDMERWETYQATGIAVTHDKAARWLRDLVDGKAKPCPK